MPLLWDFSSFTAAVQAPKCRICNIRIDCEDTWEGLLAKAKGTDKYLVMRYFPVHNYGKDLGLHCMDLAKSLVVGGMAFGRGQGHEFSFSKKLVLFAQLSFVFGYLHFYTYTAYE